MSKNDVVRALVIVASVRAERRADAMLEWWLDATSDALGADEVGLEVADLRALALPLDDEPGEPHRGIYHSERTRTWSATVAAADAFVVLTGEHNHSMPASLKNAFDHLSAEWAGKPVSWVSYGNTSAGTRSLLAAKQVASTLGLVHVGPDVSVRISELGDDGRPAQSWRDAMAAASATTLVRWAHALRALRNEQVSLPDLPVGLDASVADARDAAELLVLQRACWVEEALANDTLALRAFDESLDDVRAAVADLLVLVVRQGARIVASVRAWEADGAWHVGRLMVAPDQRRRGIAGALLRHVEALRPQSAEVLRLSTGARSTDNLRLYGSHGYTVAVLRDGVAELEKRIG